MKKPLILAGFIFLTSLHAQTGNTGINTTAPKATLDVNLPSNYANGQLAGVTIPQLTGDQIEAMSASTPKVGTIVYATAVSTASTKDVTAVGYWYWKDATDKWEPFTLGTSASGNTVDWSVNGNTGTTAANYLGTKDNQPLNFKTNANTDTNPKMTILPNGNVGIGTISPGSALHINIDGTKSPFIITTENSKGGPEDDTSIYSYSGTSKPNITDWKNAAKGTMAAPLPLEDGTKMYDLYSTAFYNNQFNILNGFTYWYNGNAANPSLSSTQFFNSGEVAMQIATNNNVGIGTTAPIEKLDVAGNIKSTNLAGTGNRTVVADANGVLRVGSDANNNTGWSLTGNTGTTPTSHYLGTTDNQPLNFKTNSTADNNPKMTILPNGNVGIGYTTPITKLNVNGNTMANSFFSFSTTPDTGSHPAFINSASFGGSVSNRIFVKKDHILGVFAFRDAKSAYDAGATVNYGGSDMYAFATEDFSATNKGSNLVFRTTPNNANISQERMRIEHNGNVGISTQNPLAKLHIDGATDNPVTGVPPAAQQANDVVVTNAGNVGIGTIAPQTSLHIRGGNSSGIFLENTIGGQTANFTSDGGIELYRDPNCTVCFNPTTSGYIDFKNAPTKDYDVRLALLSNPNGIRNFSIIQGDALPLFAASIVTRNVGISNEDPKSRLQVSGGDVYIDQIASGVIMKSPNGSCWRVTVTDTGAFASQSITCP